MNSDAHDASEVRSVHECLRLARLFVAGELGASAFESAFLHARLLQDEGTSSDRGEQFVDAVFWDVDDFVSDEVQEYIRDNFGHDEPAKNSGDIDADELRRRVAAHLAAYDRLSQTDR